MDFAVPAEHRIKLKECEKKDRYLDLVKELKKTLERENDNHTSRDRCFWCSHQTISKGSGGLRRNRMSGDDLSYYIIENTQDTEKSP